MKQAAQNARIVWLDALRLTAGLSMVLLHATSDPHGQPFPDATAAERAGPVLLRMFVYIARTELFIIIALYVLLLALEERPRSYFETARTQFRRLMLPYAFWSVFFVVWQTGKASSFGYLNSYLSELFSLKGALAVILLGKSYFHMHFLPTLLPLVLLYPLYRSAIAAPWAGLLLIPALLAKWELDNLLWAGSADAPWFPFALRAVKILTYAGYGFAAAALLALLRPRGHQAPRSWVAPLAFAGAMLLGVKLVEAIHIINTGRWNFDYQAGFWANFLMPAVLFLLVAALPVRWPQWVSRAGKFGFGIYLVHPVFLTLAEIGLARLAPGLPPLAQVLIKIAFTLALTLPTVMLIARSPLAWTIGLGAKRASPRTSSPALHAPGAAGSA